MAKHHILPEREVTKSVKRERLCGWMGRETDRQAGSQPARQPASQPERERESESESESESARGREGGRAGHACWQEQETEQGRKDKGSTVFNEIIAFSRNLGEMNATDCGLHKGAPQD